MTARKRKAKHKRRKRTIENNTQICKEDSAADKDLQSLVSADGEAVHKTYRTILADPPWQRNQQGAKNSRSAESHYRLMPLDRIKAMPVKGLAAENSHLYLWIPNGLLQEGLDVIKAWGFIYRCMLVWCKPRISLGNYIRTAHETCLFATKGKAPVKFKGQPSFIFAAQQEHSHKPEEVHVIVERLSHGPYLELFARRRPSNPEWDVWGNEIESDIVIPGYPVPEYSDRAFIADKPKEQEV